MKDREDYTLLTGATGLLGQYLTRDFLKRGQRLAVLIRSNKRASAAERLEQFMQMWEEHEGQLLPRPICMEGNINEERLGLSDADFQWVREHCGTMLHCAASLTFHEHNGEPWQTNVEGTRNVLGLCREADIRLMHYISTAYVCGHREDLVTEDQLDVGQSFRNDYEKSKFLAEQLVREHEPWDSLTVYRPVVITGDSVTGYTSTYHGTYLYMKLAKILAQNTEPEEDGFRHLAIRWALSGEERRNITPVEWNSEIICKLFANPEAHGRTFQLAPIEPITMRDAIEYSTKYFKLTGIEFLGPEFRKARNLTELEEWVWANISIYGAYDFMDPCFDRTNLEKFAPEPSCPKIDWECAKRLIDYAEKDRWGKRKTDPAESAPISVSELLAAVVADDTKTRSSDSAELLGLEVLGPGGGTWTLRVSDDVIRGFELGLPNVDQEQPPIIQLTSLELAAKLDNAGSLLSILRQHVDGA